MESELKFIKVKNVKTAEVKFFKTEAGSRIFLRENLDWRID